jgi:hypothetical protein
VVQERFIAINNGYHYLSGILRMESGRSIAQISRTAGVPIQNMHHYISKSPWSGQKVVKEVRLDIATHAHVASGSILIGDESASKFGWDEIQTTTFLAWEHQLAFTILAQWFITQTRLDWEEKIARDPQLLTRYEVTLLPAPSVANVRALLRAALPLPTLSPLDAAALVVEHLDNRTRSRKSRLLHRSGP